MWVLIFWAYTSSFTMPQTLPGYYTTRERCEEARVAFEARGTLLVPTRAACVPAPDNIGYE